MSLLGTSAGAEASVLTSAGLAGGDIRVSGPDGYCVDPNSLRRSATGGFAAIASCNILSGGAQGPVIEPALAIVTVSKADGPAPTPADPDRDAARNAVVRTYELTGLDDEAVGALRAATVGGDATGAAFALGDPNRAAVATTPSATDGGTGGAALTGDDPGNGRRGLLIGTPAAIDSVREAVSGVSEALDAALDDIDRDVS